MFDPGTGRWFQLDPIGFDGGDTNLYRFVGNGPTNATDPSGLAEEPTAGPPPPRRIEVPEREGYPTVLERMLNSPGQEERINSEMPIFPTRGMAPFIVRWKRELAESGKTVGGIRKVDGVYKIVDPEYLARQLADEERTARAVAFAGGPFNYLMNQEVAERRARDWAEAKRREAELGARVETSPKPEVTAPVPVAAPPSVAAAAPASLPAAAPDRPVLIPGAFEAWLGEQRATRGGTIAVDSGPAPGRTAPAEALIDPFENLSSVEEMVRADMQELSKHQIFKRLDGWLSQKEVLSAAFWLRIQLIAQGQKGGGLSEGQPWMITGDLGSPNALLRRLTLSKESARWLDPKLAGFYAGGVSLTSGYFTFVDHTVLAPAEFFGTGTADLYNATIPGRTRTAFNPLTDAWEEHGALAGPLVAVQMVHAVATIPERYYDALSRGDQDAAMRAALDGYAIVKGGPTLVKGGQAAFRRARSITEAIRKGRSTSSTGILGVFPAEADFVTEAETVARIRGDRLIKALGELKPGEKLTVLAHGNSRIIVLKIGENTLELTAEEFVAMLKRQGAAPGEIELVVCNCGRTPASGPGFAQRTAEAMKVKVTAYDQYVYCKYYIKNGQEVMMVFKGHKDWLATLLYKVGFLAQPARPRIRPWKHTPATPIEFPGE